MLGPWARRFFCPVAEDYVIRKLYRYNGLKKQCKETNRKEERRKTKEVKIVKVNSVIKRRIK